MNYCGDAYWIMCVIVFMYVFNVFVCFACGLLCDIVWFVVVCFVVVCVCVPLFPNVCGCVGGAVLCDVVWLVCCCVCGALCFVCFVVIRVRL